MRLVHWSLQLATKVYKQVQNNLKNYVGPEVPDTQFPRSLLGFDNFGNQILRIDRVLQKLA